MKNSHLIRLSKLMSERGICSRREAEKFIDLAQVLVDGKIISIQGTKVDRNAKIQLLKRAETEISKKVTIILNKPLGYVSNLPEDGYTPAINLIAQENQYKPEKTLHYTNLQKLAVCGRLDVNSKGLLIFTQDGTIAKKIIGENSNLEKEYIVKFKGKMTAEILKKLCFGLSLDEKKLKPCVVNILQPQILQMILKEGKKRQIRRMLELVNLRETSIKRVRVGNILLKDLPVGKWQFLNVLKYF